MMFLSCALCKKLCSVNCNIPLLSDYNFRASGNASLHIYFAENDRMRAYFEHSRNSIIETPLVLLKKVVQKFSLKVSLHFICIYIFMSFLFLQYLLVLLYITLFVFG